MGNWILIWAARHLPSKPPLVAHFVTCRPYSIASAISRFALMGLEGTWRLEDIVADRDDHVTGLSVCYASYVLDELLKLLKREMT